MRVLQVYKDYDPVLGGVEHHVQALAEGLSERGLDVFVLVTSTDGRTRHETIRGIPVTKTARLVNIQSAPVSPAFYPALRRLSARADIAHLHFPYPPAELGQLVVGRSRRFVLTYHSDIVRQRALGMLYRPFLRRVLDRADAISVSNPQYIRTSRFLQPHFGKCSVIPHGIDVSRFTATDDVMLRAAATRARYGAAPIVLSVGRLRHYKGIDVLVRAMADIPGRALIVGTGPMSATWQKLAADLGLTDRVLFLGEVPERELVELYHAADIFALPSTNRAETWGTVQIEAMACGLPVVCTELGTGTSYVNQHEVTGLVVPPGDPNALCAAVRRLVDDPAARRRMGAAGRERALRELSRDAMIDRTIALYESLERAR